jgi:hypothetical protein
MFLSRAVGEKDGDGVALGFQLLAKGVSVVSMDINAGPTKPHKSI